MTTWPTVSLKDVCENVQYGFTASATPNAVGPKFLRITDIVPDSIDWDKVPFCAINHKEMNRYSVLDGDIVVARTGATVGYAKFIKSPPSAVFASYLVRFRPCKSVCAGFVGSIIQSQAYKEWVQSQAGGSAQPNANAQVLGAFSFRLPPVDTQHRIAAILGAYDDLIEVNRRRVALLEDMARGLFEEWFVRFRFPGHEAVSMIETPDGPLPEGWEQRPFASACSLVRGRSYRSVDLADDGGMPFVNLKCMVRDGGFRASGLKRYTGDYKQQQLVGRGDIVMGVTDMTQERRIIGRVARLPLLPEPAGVISMDLVKVVPLGGIEQNYLYHWLRFSGFGQSAAAFANGANVLHLSPAALAELPTLAPTPEIQSRFATAIAPIVAQQDVIAASESNLAASRDLLLPRLISGQLSVAGAERELEAA